MEYAETPTESEESISIEYEGVPTDTPIEYDGVTPEGIANENEQNIIYRMHSGLM